MDKSSHYLLKRVSGLIKKIRDLILEKENLKKAIDKLTDENNELNTLLENLNIDITGDNKKIPGKIEIHRYQVVTVLFGNVVGFLNLPGYMNTQKYVDQLDNILLNFDFILKKYKIHKIKTIGDSYMAAGGIPVKNMTNPIQVVMAALEIQKFLKSLAAAEGMNLNVWDIQMGIHTGPVTASIRGKKKISYGIKGNTVNMASRMGAFSKNGDTLLSGMTYELVKEVFECVYYGKMPVKYKADVDLYKVEGLKPEFSVNGDKFTANELFGIKFKLIQFTDIQEIILEKLDKELPPSLYYHNVKHTIDVVTGVELIGWAEGLNDEEILILKTAGLFHDAGHIISYDAHENHGAIMARSFLPEYGYSNEQINRICEIILATRLPQKPKGLLQKIICDADLDYFGRSDMVPVSNSLYKELKAKNKITKFKEWNILQLQFLSEHQYYTKTARALREVNKQTQIDRIRKLIEEDTGEEDY